MRRGSSLRGLTGGQETGIPDILCQPTEVLEVPGGVSGLCPKSKDEFGPWGWGCQTPESCTDAPFGEYQSQAQQKKARKLVKHFGDILTTKPG